MKSLLLFSAALVLAGSSVSCSSNKGYLTDNSFRDAASNERPSQRVRTTAYSHQEMEKGGIYGRKNAVGTTLKYGRLRSAAADWSVYPVGTLFRIKGQPYVYEVDDYGSALVGTRTIDIYKPTLTKMRDWGVRHVDIEILRWGSYRKSLEIMAPRESKAKHVKQMASSIRNSKI